MGRSGQELLIDRRARMHRKRRMKPTAQHSPAQPRQPRKAARRLHWTGHLPHIAAAARRLRPHAQVSGLTDLSPTGDALQLLGGGGEAAPALAHNVLGALQQIPRPPVVAQPCRQREAGQRHAGALAWGDLGVCSRLLFARAWLGGPAPAMAGVRGARRYASPAHSSFTSSWLASASAWTVGHLATLQQEGTAAAA